jgi:hypothetical protein
MPRLDGTLTRTLLAGTALAALASAFGGPLLHALLPVHRALLAVAGPEFRLLRLSVDGTGATATLRAWADLAVPMLVDGRRLQPLGWVTRGNGWIESTITAAGAVHSTLVLLLGISVWPLASGHEALRRAALATLMCALLLTVEPPLALLANLHRSLHADADAAADPVVAIGRFLDGGGSAAIGLAAATVVVTLCAHARGGE